MLQNKCLVTGLCFLIYEKEGIQNAKPFVMHHLSCAEKHQWGPYGKIRCVSSNNCPCWVYGSSKRAQITKLVDFLCSGQLYMCNQGFLSFLRRDCPSPENAMKLLAVSSWRQENMIQIRRDLQNLYFTVSLLKLSLNSDNLLKLWI